jgi:hypothetical protein
MASCQLHKRLRAESCKSLLRWWPAELHVPSRGLAEAGPAAEPRTDPACLPTLPLCCRKATGSLKIIHDRFSKNVTLFEDYKVSRLRGLAVCRAAAACAAAGAPWLPSALHTCIVLWVQSIGCSIWCWSRVAVARLLLGSPAAVALPWLQHGCSRYHITGPAHATIATQPFLPA